MKTQSYARLYRPTKFSEIVGQPSIVKVLNYAISHNELQQCYILSGIRGTGKTTMARIIAKTVNCTNSNIINGVIEPCEECISCKMVADNSHPDILEIDAASHTGIDNIRDIIDQTLYKPIASKYKVFIIDEAHMLSRSAFNAFLKTLEEPPEWTLFILATTEINKIPDTISSRCQRLYFKNIEFNPLCHLLNRISDTESISIENDALEMIVHRSDGSARDAVMLLEHAIAQSEKKRTLCIQDVREILALCDPSMILSFLDLLCKKEASKALAIITNTDMDYVMFANDMLDLIAFCNKRKLIRNYTSKCYEKNIEQIDLLLSSVSLHDLSLIWQILLKDLTYIKSSINPITILEMFVIKSIYATTDALDTKCSTNTNINLHNENLEAKQDKTKEEILIYNEENKLNDISLLISLLYKAGDIDAYHYLYNKVGIVITASVILITSNKFDLKMHEKILEIANKHLATGVMKYEIKLVKSERYTTYKTLVENKLKLTKTYSCLAKHFPQCEIVDIIFNENSIQD